MSFAAAFLRRFTARDKLAAMQYSLLLPGREGGARVNPASALQCYRLRSKAGGTFAPAFEAAGLGDAKLT